MSTLDRERVLLLETQTAWNPIGPRQPGNPSDTTLTHTTTSAPSGQAMDVRDWLAALEHRYRAPRDPLSADDVTRRRAAIGAPVAVRARPSTTTKAVIKQMPGKRGATLVFVPREREKVKM